MPKSAGFRGLVFHGLGYGATLFAFKRGSEGGREREREWGGLGFQGFGFQDLGFRVLGLGCQFLGCRVKGVNSANLELATTSNTGMLHT